jgi:hypothetical protein
MERMLTLLLLFFPLTSIAQAPVDLKPVDVDFMVRGYFIASSQGPSELNGFGGWGGSGNVSVRSAMSTDAAGLRIEVDTLRTVPMDSIYRGQRVWLRNEGPDTVFFPAQDSRLAMWTQSLRNDTFADIEYLPSSWCGNSYHTLYLAPGEEWSFVMPKYEGRKPTRLRLVVEWKEHPGQEGVRRLFSTTFPGGVNKGQYSRKQGHQPQGLMDPYND